MIFVGSSPSGSGSLKLSLKAVQIALIISLCASNQALAWNARYFQCKKAEIYAVPLLTECDVSCTLQHYYSPFPTSNECAKRSSQTNPNKEKIGGIVSQEASVIVFKSHNWIIDYALWKLDQYGLWVGDISDSEIKYLHYGADFADHPWNGRPDSPDASKDSVIGIWDLEDNNPHGVVFDRDSFLGNRYRVESRFRGGTFKKTDTKVRPNLYLESRFRAKLFDKDVRFAADSFFHFPNRDAVNPRERDILLRSAPVVDKDRVFKGSDVSAMAYGVVLYQLARKFWPQNEDSIPDLYELPRVHSPRAPGRVKTGTLVLDPLPGPIRHEIKAHLPSTYLGGNPFICAPSDREADTQKKKHWDPCRDGKPTWPIWVPDGEAFEPSAGWDCFAHTCDEKLEESCLSYPECVADYHRALVKRFPGKSRQAALIYLGWALHMVQDLAMPRHAANWIGTVHENVERLADKMVRQGIAHKSIGEGGFSDWRVFHEEADVLFSGTATVPEICEEIQLGQSYDWVDAGLRKLMLEVRDESYRDRYKIDGKQSKVPNQRAKYTQIAFQRAILATMKLLVCFSAD
jgi:hypothetical protein